MRYSPLLLTLALLAFGCSSPGEVLQDFDGDGSLDADDCGPADASIHPTADDPYGDGIDQDCDGADGDAGDLDNDGAANDSDCAPEDSAVYPGADDPYGDGIDQDCDGGDGVDLDGDGYPSNLEVGDPLLDCNDSDAALSPADQDTDGYSSCDGDCNDLDASLSPVDADADDYSLCDGDCDDINVLMNPGMTEVCDLFDNDCDPNTTEPGDEVDGDGDGDPACSDCDDTDGTVETLDVDADGATTCSALPDCNDGIATTYPGAADGYGDGVDSNCDGVDGVDADGDGYSAPAGDCDDSNAALTPLDSDTDGYSSCDGDCNDLDASMTPNDGDLDGYSTCDGDCDDSNDSMSPDQVEVCDLIDNDCDSSTGEGGDGVDGDGDGDAACSDCDDSDGTTETLDRDGDGISTCGPDGLPDTSDDDCDDNNNSFYPGAPDVYGDIADHNCDGTDGIDSDGDGVAVLGGDCNDGDATEYAGAPEICNGELENCDGTLPDDEVDGDGDGYVECVGWVGTDPLVIGDGDCGPTDAGTYPGAPEPCSGIDNDCNGTVDGNFDLDGDGYSPCAGDCDDDDVNSEIAGLLTTAQGIGFRSICAGSFEMGCTAGQSNCASQESPVHTVTLTHTFELGETEVTQSQWQALMGTNPSYFSSTGAGADCGWDCPVETVNWWASLAFANALSSAEGLAECYQVNGTNSVTVTSATGSVYDCEGYRLPTEAEWEHAARAGADLLYAGSNTLDDVAWHEGNGDWTTHPVGTMVPNAWSLYDMSGNVWEWTWDWYDSAYYSSINVWTNPEGSAAGSSRVRRGGSWRHSAYDARVAKRSSKDPGSQDWSHGLRPARTLP